MEMESYISLGGNIILLTLVDQKYIFGQKYSPLFEKGTKPNQNKLMETTETGHNQSYFI